MARPFGSQYNIQVRFIFFSFLFVTSILAQTHRQGAPLGDDSHWNPKEGIDFCNGNNLKTLLALANSYPSSEASSDSNKLTVSNWEPLSEIRKTWGRSIAKDQSFDAKVKSVFVFHRLGGPKGQLTKPAIVALSYWNGSKEKITIDLPVVVTSKCSFLVYDKVEDVPKGSIYRIVNGLYLVTNLGNTNGILNQFESKNLEEVKVGDQCECEYTPMNFPTVKVKVVCGGKNTSCECLIKEGPFIHRLTYLYTMTASCGGKESKSIPLSGELGVEKPIPRQRVIKR